MPKVISKIVTDKKMVIYDNSISDDLFSTKDFNLLQRVIKRINSILDLDELLTQIIKDASDTLGFEKCGVLLYDEKVNEFELVAVTGWEDKIHPVGSRFEEGIGVIWRAFHKKKPIYYPDIYEFPEDIHCDFASRSHIDIPLVSKGKIIGIFNAQHKNVDGFSRHKIQVLKVLAAHVSVAIQNSILYESEKEEKEIIIRDLQEAKQIQKRLFPTESPAIENFIITGMCEPSLEVGGDWYDYIQLPSGKVGILVGDVAGKGLGAAFLMSSARMILRMFAIQEESPSNVMQNVNKILTADMPAARFITMIYGIIDPKSKTIALSNAGHPDPVLCAENKSEFLVTERGLPLGIKEYPYKEIKIKMEKGDKLFLYSDGVSEAMNSKREMFDDYRIIKSLNKPGADYKTLYKDIETFIGDNQKSDDLTIVMMEAI